MVDWQAIKTEYIAGGTSYRKLAQKYGVSKTTLTKTAIREGWVDLRNQTDSKTTAKIIESASKKNAKRLIKLGDAADKLIEKICANIDDSDFLDADSCKKYSSALRDLMIVKGVKSELDVEEQKARIANLVRQANGGAAGDTEDNESISKELFPDEHTDA